MTPIGHEHRRPLSDDPAPPRRIALAALVQLRLRRHVRTRLAGCDAVVLGGGNLLTDADLNFPMKIAGALAQAARLRLPVAVNGVGANRQWSEAGRRLFGRARAGDAEPLSRALWPCCDGSRACRAARDPAAGRIVLTLDPSAFPGSYAKRALAACAERERCAVVGELAGAAPGQGPGFVYLRDRRTGAAAGGLGLNGCPFQRPLRRAACNSARESRASRSARLMSKLSCISSSAASISAR